MFGVPFLLRGAAALAASGAYVHYRTRQVEEAFPPTGQFVEVDHIRLHYLERGEGRPVVLLHGAATMAVDFEHAGLLGRLAERYHVLAFDRPGYGYSDRPRSRIWSPAEQARLIREALARLGIEHPVVIGHSWGAMVAMALALDYPQTLAGVVLASGYYYPTVRPDVPVGGTAAIPVIGDLMRHTVSPLLVRALWPELIKRIFAPCEVPERFARFPAWMMLRPNQLQASSAEIALVVPCALEMSQRYHELTVPTVLLVGRSDQLVPAREHSLRLHAELPQTELKVLEGLGHMLHYQAPEALCEAVDRLVAAQSSGAAGAPVSEDSDRPPS